ncbi:MAG TPA: hypothetical protein VFB62_03645 [Polyangiaceae bacterium]|nr:hypothetical protein [Polyangiaceae bacterium]
MALADFSCPNCSQKLTADADTLTRKMRCPRCGTAFRPIDGLDHNAPLPALFDLGASSDSEPPPLKRDEDIPAPPASLNEAWLSNEPSSALKAAEPSRVFSFEAVQTATLGEPRLIEDVSSSQASPASDGVLVAEELPDSEPSPSKRARSGTVIIDEPQRRESKASAARPAKPSGARARERLSSWLAALAAPSEQLLGEIAKRLKDRNARIASIAAPVLALLFLILLGVSDSAIWRWLLAVVAFSLGFVVLTVALATVVTRRKRPTAAPSASRGVIAAGLAVPAALAALLTGAVAMSSSPGDAEDEGTPRVAAQMAAPTASASARPKPKVDDKLQRDVRERSGNGSLYVPPHFAPDGSEFDLLVHFHGSATVVEQSVNAAKLNALVYVVSKEKGKNYWKQFGPPGSFAAMLSQIEADVDKRGLPDAKVRRVAVSSWSVGYGAISQMLSFDAAVERLDAVLILEGLVAGWLDENKRERVDPNKITPFVRFAELAVDDKKLFVITHSNAKTRDYASTRTVTDTMLEQLNIEREPTKGAPPKPKFEAATKQFPKGPVWLEAATTAHKGGFYVLAYKGENPELHIAHFVQMSGTALPLLVDRWK